MLDGCYRDKEKRRKVYEETYYINLFDYIIDY